MIPSENNGAANSNNAAAPQQLNPDGKNKAAPQDGQGNGNPAIGYSYAPNTAGRSNPGSHNMNRVQGEVPPQQQMYGYPYMPPQTAYYPPSYMPVNIVPQGVASGSPQGQKMSTSSQHQVQKGKKSGGQQHQSQQQSYPGQQQQYRAPQFTPQGYQYSPMHFPQQVYYQPQTRAPTHSQPVREKKILEIINPHTNETVTPSPLKQSGNTQSEKKTESAAPAVKKSAAVDVSPPKVNAAAEMLAQAKARLEEDKVKSEEAKRKVASAEKQARDKLEEEAQRKMLQKQQEMLQAKRELEANKELEEAEERKRKEREAKLRMEEMNRKRQQAQAAEEAEMKSTADTSTSTVRVPESIPSESKDESVSAKPRRRNGKFIYSVVELLGFKERPECKRVPPSLSPDRIDMLNIITTKRSSARSNRGGYSGRGNFDRSQMNRQNSGQNLRQNGGSQWARGSQPARGQGNNRQNSRGAPGRPVPMQIPTRAVEPMKRSKNAWKPGSGIKTAYDKYVRDVTQILNKLSREKFEKLFHQLVGLRIASVKMLSGLVQLIRDKALTEPKFGDLYADLCQRLVEKTSVPKDVPKRAHWDFVKIIEQEGQFFWTQSQDSESDDYLKGPFESEEKANKDSGKATELRRILLNQCQKEFEQEDKYAQLEKEEKGLHEKLKTETVTEEQNKIKLELAEVEYKKSRTKQRILGNINFIGELFKKGIITTRVMVSCITHLTGQQSADGEENVPDEENVECLCKLLTTMGKDLEGKKDQANFLDHVFQVLHSYSEDKKHYDARHRFMCKDVIELRKSNWVARRKELKAKTKEEIRKDALAEEAQKAAESQAANARMHNNRGRYGNAGRRDNRMGMGSGGPVMGSVATGSRMAQGFKLGGSSRSGPQDPRFQSKNRVSQSGNRQLGSGARTGGMSMRPGGGGTTKGGFRPGGNRGSGLRAPKVRAPAARQAEPVQASVPKLEDSEWKRKVKETLKEFVQVNDEKELVRYIKELEPRVPSIAETRKNIVEECAAFVMEKGKEEREWIPKAVIILVKNQLLTAMIISNALSEFLEFLPDIKVDAPFADKHLGEFLAQLILNKVLPLKSLPKCFEKLLDDDYNMRVALSSVGIILQELVKNDAGEGVVDSDLTLSFFFHGKASQEQLADLTEKYNLGSLFSA
mmetsp:Transcript_15585/g.20512  ORF Transcript_15585/g.20512 Transcript_15585/m.20512 type:complete len:1158 (-) Transcript_15585:483-3956(-)